MFHTLYRLVTVAGVVGLLAGCGANPGAATCSPEPSRPAWADRPTLDDAIASVGIAKSAGGTGRAREKARAAGRDELARILQTRAKGMTDRFFREAAIDNEAGRAEDFTRTVSRQLVKQSLSGSRAVKYWRDSCTEETYALMALDTSSVLAQLKTSGAAAVRELNLVEQQADDALKKMEDAIDREFGAPN